MMKTLHIFEGFRIPGNDEFEIVKGRHFDDFAVDHYVIDEEGHEQRMEIRILTAGDIKSRMRDFDQYYDDVVFDGRDEPKQISLDNGRTFLTAEEAIEKLKADAEEYETPFEKLWQNVADMMDDDLREQVHAELAPCTEEEFLERYLELSDEDLIVG